MDFPPTEDASCHSAEALHRHLAASHLVRLSPQPDDSVRSRQAYDAYLRAECDVRRLERDFVEGERAAIADLVRGVPRDVDGFVCWFASLKEAGPGQSDPLFAWLDEAASLEQMLWFLEQEVAGEAGFDDLVALAQLKLPTVPKLELARNYWDEMGQGHECGMHGPMLGLLKDTLGLDASNPVWETLSLANLMVALATSRHYQYQALGALGVIELTAPGRAVHVNAGLKRLGVVGTARRYFALHATLDVRHSETWVREVFRPLVASDPSIAPRLAEGALMRLRAGERCFERYRRELWGPYASTESEPAAAE